MVANKESSFSTDTRTYNVIDRSNGKVFGHALSLDLAKHFANTIDPTRRWCGIYDSETGKDAESSADHV